MCLMNYGIEDTEHFLMLCFWFDVQRRDILADISAVLRPSLQINILSNYVLMPFSSYGYKEIPSGVKKNLPEPIANFIHKTDRFDKEEFRNCVFHHIVISPLLLLPWCRFVSYGILEYKFILITICPSLDIDKTW